jgi:hypothetical protein
LHLAPPQVIDSIRPIEEEVHRFRGQVSGLPRRLEGGARSRDALVRTWVRAVERRDTLALRRLLLAAGEFIAFYYPESPFTAPPYRQAPGVRWFLMVNASSQGVTRVLRRHGGTSLGFRGYACDSAPTVLGRNRLWTRCRLRLVEGERVVERRLFGPILERDGRFKFLTYASDY